MIIPMVTFLPQLIIFCLGFVFSYLSTKVKTRKASNTLEYIAATCFIIAVIWFIHLLYTAHSSGLK